MQAKKNTGKSAATIGGSTNLITATMVSNAGCNELNQANIGTIVLSVLMCFAMIAILGICLIFVCQIPLPSRLKNIVDKISRRLKYKEKLVLQSSGSCVDTETLVNHETPTSIQEDESGQTKANSYVPPIRIETDLEDYYTVNHEGYTQEVYYFNSPVISKKDHFLPTFTTANKNISSLIHTKKLSGSEPLLTHVPAYQQQKMHQIAENKLNSPNDNKKLAMTDDYLFKNKMLKSKSSENFSSKGIYHNIKLKPPQLYAHLHEVTKQDRNIYDG